ncbi:MAG TPA: biotin/lipoyl-binding protein [Gemmataceae bacterium]|jgi:multidrug resistance efflux pump|nr:biotin/lipoyl-binding protein [Gemmataceae bacterium]
MTRGRIISVLLFLAISGVALTALMAAKDANDSPGALPKATVAGKKLVCIGTVDTESRVAHIYPDNYPAPAKVLKVLVKDGDEVKAGQPLLELDAEMLRLKVTEAEKAVAVAEAAKGKAVAMVKGYEPEVEALRKTLQAKEQGVVAATRELAELERSRKHDLVTQAQLEAGQAKVKEAQLNLESADEKLKGLLKVGSPDYLVKQADMEIDRFKVNLEQAQYALSQHTCKAPADGKILRAFPSEGQMFIPQRGDPAFWFLKKGALVVRAEISQEFANRVKAGAAARIEDEADRTQTWPGKVTHVGDQFLPKRTSGAAVDLVMVSDERVLECLISIDVATGETAPRYGQKVRVTLGE